MLRLRQQAPMWPFWIEKTLLQDSQFFWPLKLAESEIPKLKSGRPMAGFTPLRPSETVKRRKCNVKVTEPILQDNLRGEDAEKLVTGITPFWTTRTTLGFRV